MWGTVAIHHPDRHRRRFIPTCVGNGRYVRLTPILGPVHPHVCGERGSYLASLDCPGGSSPRVWGTDRCNRYPPDFLRFIPTCVGNGSTNSCAGISSPVHPHVCGERALYCQAPRHDSGSSPRVWGTVPTIRPCAPRSRFIPTCVGNGRVWVEGERQGPVHPHVCGERLKSENLVGQVAGSSPRVWGTVLAAVLADGCWRFIPTCVGNGEGLPTAPGSGAVHPHVCGERVCTPSNCCHF